MRKTKKEFLGVIAEAGKHVSLLRICTLKVRSIQATKNDICRQKSTKVHYKTILVSLCLVHRDKVTGL